MTHVESLRTDPTPSRVLYIDLDGILPSFLDEEYDRALVIGARRGIPVGVADIDLRQDPGSVADQMAALLAMPEQSGSWADFPVGDAELPMISVVVPTIFERADELERLLDGFMKLDYPNVEFIIVDNRRTVPGNDILPELIDGKPSVRLVRAQHPGISAARNVGAAAARGDIVAFTDDDVAVDRNWLRAIGRRFVLQPELQAITGLVLPSELETPSQIWYERYYGGFGGIRTFAPVTLRSSRSSTHLLRGSQVEATGPDGVARTPFSIYGIGAYAAGANMSFRRSALTEIGGFDLSLGTGTPARGGEDLASIINILWLGGAVGFEPAAVVHHRHRRDFVDLVSQLRGNGLGFTAMLTSLIHHDPRHLVSLGSQLPRAAGRIALYSTSRLFRRGASTRSAATALSSHYPRSLVLHEVSNYLAGPLAYRKSLLKTGAVLKRLKSDVTVS